MQIHADQLGQWLQCRAQKGQMGHSSAGQTCLGQEHCGAFDGGGVLLRGPNGTRQCSLNRSRTVQQFLIRWGHTIKSRIQFPPLQHESQSGASQCSGSPWINPTFDDDTLSFSVEIVIPVENPSP